MFFIKKILHKIFPSKITSTNEDLQILIGIDTITEKINFIINTNISNLVDDNSNIQKCEKIAFFLSLISYNNKYMIDMISNHINEQSRISNEHLLFYNNILFFWKQYLSIKKDISIVSNDEPLIAPTKAFKIHILENQKL